MARTRSRAMAAVVALALLLGACGEGSDSAAVRDASGAVIDAGSWSVFDLRAGDCIGDVSSLAGDSADVPLVPCSEPHTMEVFAVVRHADDVYPGAAAVASFADRACLTALEAELRMDPNDDVAFSYLLPTSEGWNDHGDRAIVCVLVVPEDAGVAGS